MASETIRTTDFTAPDPAAGGGACSGSGTTGGCTAVRTCNQSTVLVQSIRWKTWQTAPNKPSWTAATLRVAYSIPPGPVPACAGTQSIALQYSTNNGSSWSNMSGFPKESTAGTQSGTATATLSPSVNLAQLVVRGVVTAQVAPEDVGCPEFPCSVGAGLSVSDVRIDATYAFGACCVGELCKEVTSANCDGVFQGDGTTCGTGSCVGESKPCCLPNGSCSMLPQSACVAAGGTWKPNNSSCSQVNCSQPGCCVRANGTCAQTSQSACNNAGDSWLGPGTSCTVAPDGHNCGTCNNVGACCTGATCFRASQCWCEHAGGAFRGVSSVCSPSPCAGGVYFLLL